MADKVPARTHKKHRVNKKWLKRYGMKEVPWTKFYIMGDQIYCHPKMISKIEMEIGMNEESVY